MENNDNIEIILRRFLQELASLENKPVELLTITLTVDSAHFPKRGNTQSIIVKGQRKRINEQRGSDPLHYHITCYEK
ncbi:hypothetical protein CLV51_1011315 [Chitinophaga niastensis]|uniref:Uncharacterized protein n=1 Tax=Chitinophaga niastensis TaxID=536980 RepID=A0A2P8HUS5_CHINA|nr:hypothetical protein [Chitinophaga niastensis]PSL49973.1 hypothetical protein CLV51_1011315 [Chitinophaga niastensis]